MGSQYRQFGEAQKTVLSAGKAFDLRTSPPTANGITLPCQYKFVVIKALTDSNVSFALTHDIQGDSAVYTNDIKAGQEIIGACGGTINSGSVQVFFYL